MMTDRELLQELFDFMVKRNFVLGDEKSVRDMVLRYAQPPLTMHHRVCMQMTVQDYEKLGKLLERIVEHFNPDNLAVEEIPETETMEIWQHGKNTGKTIEWPIKHDRA